MEANLFDQFDGGTEAADAASAAQGPNMFDQFDPAPEAEEAPRDPFRVSETPVADMLETGANLPSEIGEHFVDGVENYTTAAADMPGMENPVTAAANLARPFLESINSVGSLGADAWMATYGQIPGVAGVIEDIANSDVAVKALEAFEKGGKWWDSMKKAHPVEAAIVADAGVVTEVLPAGQVPAQLAKRARKLKRQGNEQQIVERRDGITEMILPDSKVGAGKTSEVGHGPTRRTVLEPDFDEGMTAT
jgi:hypothetical protein